MDLKLIFLIVAAFFIQEVKKQIHLCVIVNFLNDDTLAIEFNYNNTFDHINITSDEFDNLKVRGYKYKDVVPFLSARSASSALRNDFSSSSSALLF